MERRGFLSLLPILVAIVVAVATRKVILALFLGVFVGTLTLAGANPIEATTSLVRDDLVVQPADGYNAGVLVLLVFIGGFVALMERSGGAGAFAVRVAPRSALEIGGHQQAPDVDTVVERLERTLASEEPVPWLVPTRVRETILTSY